jgi:hypothetical protein
MLWHISTPKFLNFNLQNLRKILDFVFCLYVRLNYLRGNTDSRLQCKRKLDKKKYNNTILNLIWFHTPSFLPSSSSKYVFFRRWSRVLICSVETFSWIPCGSDEPPLIFEVPVLILLLNTPLKSLWSWDINIPFRPYFFIWNICEYDLQRGLDPATNKFPLYNTLRDDLKLLNCVET